ncbi:hypothetical protein, partial [Roseateles chitinivorans]|uniref:hypothetical protein n=1 Tax=Roseateles chitinivorans TaxID=2917965 RepID=UPI001E37C5DC
VEDTHQTHLVAAGDEQQLGTGQDRSRVLVLRIAVRPKRRPGWRRRGPAARDWCWTASTTIS